MKPPDPMMKTPFEKRKAVFDAIFCASCLAIFAFLVTGSFLLKIIAFLPLTVVAFMMYQSFERKDISIQVLLREAFSVRLFSYIILSGLMGIAGALYYRGSLGMPVLPAFFKLFSLVAVCIGIMEELVFRGFIQGRLGMLNALTSIIGAASAQALYKASLFLSPDVYFQPGIFRFFIVSFLAFIILGLLRNTSKSIIPAIIAHAIFDVLVYAETVKAPWWVW